jgi:hypothetical protein
VQGGVGSESVAVRVVMVRAVAELEVEAIATVLVDIFVVGEI